MNVNYPDLYTIASALLWYGLVWLWMAFDGIASKCIGWNYIVLDGINCIILYLMVMDGMAMLVLGWYGIALYGIVWYKTMNGLILNKPY